LVDDIMAAVRGGRALDRYPTRLFGADGQICANKLISGREMWPVVNILDVVVGGNPEGGGVGVGALMWVT